MPDCNAQPGGMHAVTLAACRGTIKRVELKHALAFKCMTTQLQQAYLKPFPMRENLLNEAALLLEDWLAKQLSFRTSKAGCCDFNSRERHYRTEGG